jgi:hypothetical protein
VTLGELAASADLAEPGPLVDWLQAAVAGTLPPHDGALLVADVNFNVQRRIEFRGARLSGLAWPVLDAAAGKQPVTLALRWLADSADDVPPAGKLVRAAGKRKAPMAANFRVGGLPFDGAAVTQVGLPELTVAWVSDRVGGVRPGLQLASRQLGPLTLVVSARQAEAARSWVRKLVSDGAIEEAEGLTLQVDLLDATLKKALVTVQLNGCLLVGMDEDTLDATAAERPPGLTLRFDVAGMSFTLA